MGYFQGQPLSGYLAYRHHSGQKKFVYCVAVVADIIVIEQIHGFFDVAEVEFLTWLEPFGPGGERGA